MKCKFIQKAKSCSHFSAMTLAINELVVIIMLYASVILFTLGIKGRVSYTSDINLVRATKTPTSFSLLR